MFAYCNNNPISLCDSSGYRPIASSSVKTETAAQREASCQAMRGVYSYSTVDDAAMGFANATYAKSRFIRHEYGTIIYSTTSARGYTTFNYANPVSGNPHGVGYGNVSIPRGAIIVATAHTHPNSNSFSGMEKDAASGDIPNAINRGLDSFVIGPNLNLQKYSVLTNSINIVGIAKLKSLTREQQNVLVSRFEISWDSHLETCNFGCEDMSWPTP